MQSEPRKIIVTGANKGIGYSIVEGLMTQETPYKIILTSRNQKKGEEAAKTLQEKYKQSPSTIIPQQLDIIDAVSVQHFVDGIKHDFGTIDVLVNNAGILVRKQTKEDKLAIINTNFLSTIQLTKKLLPYLAKDGKIIMVSSKLGVLADQGNKGRETLEDPNISEEKLVDIAGKLYEDYEQEKHDEIGFSEDAYATSKALLNAYTRWVLTKTLTEDQQCFTCTPGHCRTDMGGENAPRSAEEGADTIIYLVGLPYQLDKGLNGKFFADRAIIDF